MNFDLLIRNGTVIDGTGAEATSADIGLCGERIKEIGNLSHARAGHIIDALGQIVCPGLIDAHSHSDAYLLIEPHASSKVFQGVTTEVCGNCGASAAPRLGTAQLPSDWQDKPFPDSWRTVKEYRKLFETVQPAVNEALLIGHNTLHRGLCGYDPRGATLDELSKMRHALERAFDEGGCGLSTGLIYPPASAVPQKEIVELATICAARGKIYTSHMRSEGKNLLDAIDETVEIGRRSGVRIQISHLKASGKANWHKMDEVLEKIQVAQNEGTDLAADRYPYTAAQTDLDIILPDWAIQGGREAEMARLRDPKIRKKIRDEILEGRNEFEFRTIRIGSIETPLYHSFRGMKLEEAAKRLNMEPVDALLHLIQADELRVSGLFFGMSDENLWRILEQPWVMIGSDASLRAPDGILSRDHPHPRAYGSFTKFLRAALDGKTVPLPEAIRKMTSLPAKQFCLKQRGVLKRNAFADILVFDSHTIKEKTSYANPHKLSDGVKALIVNGTLTIEDGKLTGRRNGRFLD